MWPVPQPATRGPPGGHQGFWLQSQGAVTLSERFTVFVDDSRASSWFHDFVLLWMRSSEQLWRMKSYCSSSWATTLRSLSTSTEKDPSMNYDMLLVCMCYSWCLCVMEGGGRQRQSGSRVELKVMSCGRVKAGCSFLLILSHDEHSESQGSQP